MVKMFIKLYITSVIITGFGLFYLPLWGMIFATIGITGFLFSIYLYDQKKKAPVN
jgi:hypothetical protein